MADPRTQTVLIHPKVGSAETGFWCEQCLRSSAVRFPLTGIVDTHVLDLGSIQLCLDCNGVGDIATAIDGWRVAVEQSLPRHLTGNSG